MKHQQIMLQRFHLNFSTFNAVYLSFCLTGAVNNESALFTYDSEYLLDAYNYAPRHDVSFIPVFSVPENPDDPLANQASELCSGEGAQFCRYDKKTFIYFLSTFIHYNNNERWPSQ